MSSFETSKSFDLMKRKVEDLLKEHESGSFTLQEMEALLSNRLPDSTDSVDYAVIAFWALSIAIVKDERARLNNPILGTAERTLDNFDD